MKTRTRSSFFSFIVAAVLLISFPVMNTGCSTTTKSEVAAYKTLYAVGYTGRTALNSWLKYAILKEAELKRTGDTQSLAMLSNQEQQVKSAYDVFRTAWDGALTIAQLDATTLAPENVVGLLNDLTALVFKFTGTVVK